MKNKKEILKKYVGKGGPGQNDVSQIVRTQTKANYPIPRESPQRPTIQSSRTSQTGQQEVKPWIPYSKTMMSPASPGLNNVVVPSSRIPKQANLQKPFPAPSRKGMIPSQTHPTSTDSFPKFNNTLTPERKILKKNIRKLV